MCTFKELVTAPFLDTSVLILDYPRDLIKMSQAQFDRAAIKKKGRQRQDSLTTTKKRQAAKKKAGNAEKWDQDSDTDHQAEDKKTQMSKENNSITSTHPAGYLESTF